MLRRIAVGLLTVGFIFNAHAAPEERADVIGCEVKVWKPMKPPVKYTTITALAIDARYPVALREFKYGSSHFGDKYTLVAGVAMSPTLPFSATTVYLYRNTGAIGPIDPPYVETTVDISTLLSKDNPSPYPVSSDTFLEQFGDRIFVECFRIPDRKRLLEWINRLTVQLAEQDPR